MNESSRNAGLSRLRVFPQVVQQLEAAVGRARQCRGRPGAPDLAVVIDGRALVTALGADCKAKFLELGMACKVRNQGLRNPELPTTHIHEAIDTWQSTRPCMFRMPLTHGGCACVGGCRWRLP